MGEPFLGEIKIAAFNYAPRGWAFCNGQLLPINQNAALFSILGTTYGGNGSSTFALPDLRGRMPVHPGNGISLGNAGGADAQTLLTSQLPAHVHPATATTSSATTGSPANALWATSPASSFAAGAPNATMTPGAIASVGGGQPHENRPPFLQLSFIVALQGIFPSRT